MERAAGDSSGESIELSSFSSVDEDDRKDTDF
jgi:hypothetical protein